MDNNSSVFSLSIDPVSKMHLSEAAKWARFLAIVGFIFLVLLVAAGIVMTMTVSELEDQYFRDVLGRSRMTGVMRTSTAVSYIVAAIIYFFPLLFTLRFANHTKAALAADNQERLNASFQNLKATLRYMGVLTIIGLVFIVIAIAVAGAGFMALN